MRDIAIYTLTSALHDEEAVAAVTRDFLGSLGIDYDFRGNDYSDFGQHPLDLIYVRTGGTEGIFRQLLPTLRQQSSRPFRLLTSGKSNSLAASLEILSYLRRHELQGEILHGSTEYITTRLRTLTQAEQACQRLKGLRLGIIGAPSDWLISSDTDPALIRERMGIELVNVEIQELIDAVGDLSHLPAREGAEVIYDQLKRLVNRHHLQGFTLRCFDLLSTAHNTGCLALAHLNAEGIVSGCEGDVPALLSMAVVNALTGVSGFQANPARIHTERGELLFAHCTIPLNMVERYELDTHFESGIGIGIRGFSKAGPVTLFKLSPDLNRYFVAEGELESCQAKPDLCRTQQVIRLANPQQSRYFLTNPIGNHHIVAPGHLRETLEVVLSLLNIPSTQA
ncbi:MAG: hypothetical protein K6A32_01335 [Bacteroidales bacterium]|nr:hypothetical protein [Bacteroidales bacterium]